MAERVLIVGGGASGLMCAVRYASRGNRVIVLERSDRVGKKLLATGNGKCNLTNINLSVADYNTTEIKSIIETYSPQIVIKEFASMGLLTKTDAEGRVYPYSESANTVLNVLLRKLDEYGVEIVSDCLVESIAKEGAKWIANTSKGQYLGNKMIIACGSDATSGLNSHSLVEPLGHKASPIAYAITPLVTNDVKGASGVRAKVYAAIYINKKFVMGERGEMLFKDNALSGILSLRLSSALARCKEKVDSCKVVVDFIPDLTQEQLSHFIFNNSSPFAPLEGILHKALAFNVIARTPMDRSLIMSRKKADDLAKVCKNFEINISGLSGRANAQVACGGIDLKDLDKCDLQSKLHKGLYCIGESVDVDGFCGGYNLHWAWASAMAASEENNDKN